MREWSQLQRQVASSVGFVPTMGALHEGHLQLLRQSREENVATVLSIFVNPTQFNNSNDFDKYPRSMEHDIELARSIGIDAVYAPESSTMYPEGFDTSIDPGSIARSMEGEFRPRHFEGVSTVVVKLLNTVKPHRLYLGQKDFQQLAVLRHVVSDLDMDVSVVGVPTIRENDGLAMSSRNVRLTEEQRRHASSIYSALTACQTQFRNGERNVDVLKDSVLSRLSSIPMCKVEYVSIVDADTLETLRVVHQAAVVCLAVYFGDVRLIDNVILRSE